MKINRAIVTGGCGFIGSALVRSLVSDGVEVLVVDKLTYAGVRQSIPCDNSLCRLLVADICDEAVMREAFEKFSPDTIFHLAAESHVDRSIDGPLEFVRTNVLGTAVLLNVSLEYWRKNPAFRFQHISTDEVYGSLGKEGLFTESTPYCPHSPYSATKASSDHLVRAWHDTYALPVLITNCSNNYGPCQFPEKLVPLTILNCLEGKPLPVYGTGENVRDWLHVEDHVKALRLVNEKGVVGETYNIGASSEKSNIEVVNAICSIMDELVPKPGMKHSDLITFVKDRPGHDLRYAIDSSKLASDLGWRNDWNFENGIYSTVEWYLANRWWWEDIRSGRYRGERLGSGV